MFTKSSKGIVKIAIPIDSVYLPNEFGNKKKLLLHGNSHALIELYNALYPSRTGKKGKYILFIKFPP